ncbi:cytochrome C [Paucibacter sp. KBW04]|uniref:c-type cytochrome n=1 Tax=Paucibacter sp. KBW04 TaxID=2153361 RepID=UPI000F575D48|nr:c-type cytochrome [Paucibacter sp. KBW04]RQO54709.1 cytochrome C [Paucibacter sp. KBW04]
MFNSPKLRMLALVLSAGVTASMAQQPYAGVGRAATPKELQAWDIDVRPDFKGLPKGSGSVTKGQEVWESKCASCHGVFGESNEVFSPLVGGTTAQDVMTGRVARLTDASFPGRTTLMKVPTVSTLWDYINRAMPWNAPKSLHVDEVFGVTAYLLNMGGIVPDDFVLSNETMALAQSRLPNRNGHSTDHGLWPGKSLGNGGKPDVKAVACMSDCAAEAKVASFLPAFARNNNGNLAEQQRLVGPQRGADTTQAAPTNLAAASVTTAAVAKPARASKSTEVSAYALAQKSGCTACHGLDNKIVGPGLREISAKYSKRADAQSYLAGKIKTGGQGVWGAIPMPPQSLPEAEIATLAQWLIEGAKQ